MEEYQTGFYGVFQNPSTVALNVKLPSFSGVKLKHKSSLYPRKLSQYRKMTGFPYLENEGCMEYISEKSKLNSHLMRSGYLDLFQGR